MKRSGKIDTSPWSLSPFEAERDRANGATARIPMSNGTAKPFDRFTMLRGDDVFFVPCQWGTKVPLVKYVERPFADTKSETYRAVFDLKAANLAMYLGQASGGLCALDFDDDADLAESLELLSAATSTPIA